MGVTVEKLDEALVEAHRFIKKVHEARNRLLNDKYQPYSCKETGAVRRASIDLSRSLVKIRSSEN